MESGWDMKRLHRSIVTSDAYRRVSSAGDAENVARDPENQLLWRMNAGRMEAEVVRDSLLYVRRSARPDDGRAGVGEQRLSLTTYRRSLYYSVHPEQGGKSELGELVRRPRRRSNVIAARGASCRSRRWR
jgi:hypothetical protein